MKAAQVAWEANQREIARLQTFVDRFGAKTMGASLAQSKLKTIEKLESAAPEAPIVTDGPPPVLKLPTPPRGTNELLELQHVDLVWHPRFLSKSPYDLRDDSESDSTITATRVELPTEVKSADSKFSADDRGDLIISDCSMRIERGMRIVVRGPNGAGSCCSCDCSWRSIVCCCCFCVLAQPSLSILATTTTTIQSATPSLNTQNRQINTTQCTRRQTHTRSWGS